MSLPYQPRRRDPHVISRKAAADRIMELYHEGVGDLTLIGRLRKRFDDRFGHPVRGNGLQRLSDNVRRWWAWNVSDDRSETVLSRFWAKIRPKPANPHYAGSKAELAAELRAAFAQNGITDDSIFGPPRPVAPRLTVVNGVAVPDHRPLPPAAPEVVLHVVKPHDGETLAFNPYELKETPKKF